MFKRLIMWLRGFRSGHAYPGFVGSRDRSDLYWVKLSPSNEFVKVKQLQIVHTEIIPMGTAVLIVYCRGEFYMQVPVWVG